MTWPDDYINKVICGDCLEVMRGIPDGAVDMVVTSPPYNIVSEHSGGGPNSNRETFYKNYNSGAWYPDDLPEEDYQQWQKECMREMLRVCGGSVFYNHKVRYAIKRRGVVYHPLSWLGEFPLWCEVIWQKDMCGQKVPRFNSVDERIYQFQRPRVWNECGYSTVWHLRHEQQRNGHPCPFPLTIPRRCIRSTTNPGHIVLDPFVGSGTTVVAAKQMKRDFVGIEIDPAYCKIAEDRLRQEELF